MINWTEAQTAKIDAAEAADEFFQKFIERYEPNKKED